MAKKKLYGFWHYDLFPHVIGGPLGAKCRPSGYPGAGYYEWEGTGMFVRPLFILEEAAGVVLHEQLKALHTQYRAICDQVHTACKAQADALIADAKKREREKKKRRRTRVLQG